MRSWITLSIAAALLAMPAAAESVRTVNGYTIKLGATIYRMWGIDAANKGQRCADGWP